MYICKKIRQHPLATMKIYIRLFSFVFILISCFSCKRDPVITKSPLSGCIPSSSYDSVVYNNIPDITVTTVRTIMGGIVPSDSSTTLQLDITGDGINDIVFYLSHAYIIITPNSRFYSHNRSVVMLNLLDSIAFVIDSSWGAWAHFRVPNCLVFGDTVYSNLRYSSYADIISTSSAPATPYYYEPDGDHYYGVKLFRGGNIYYGWILINENVTNYSLTVKEYAINKSGCRKILAGQNH